MTVLVFGSINMDLAAYVPQLPRPGETLFGNSFKTVPGGKGANQAVAAARLGASVKMIGRVGNDAFGHEHLSVMRKEGINIDSVTVDRDRKTGAAIIQVDPQGENTIVVISGANMAVGQIEVDLCAAALDRARVLLLQLEVPLEAIHSIAQKAHERQVVVILDPAPVMPLPPELYPLIDIITPNEVEVETLVGFPVDSLQSASSAAADLRTRGARTALIKMGGKGVVFEAEGESGRIAPFQVDVVDTVAAGDAFNGGLAAAINAGLGLKEALQWGSAAGALAVTREGAISSLPHLEDLTNLLETQ